MKEDNYTDYPVFKGLQKPLEFMGIQGRYIVWAATAAGSAVALFIIAYCIFGFLVALVLLAATLTAGTILIMFKQRQGLHSKKIDRGVKVYSHSKKW